MPAPVHCPITTLRYTGLYLSSIGEIVKENSIERDASIAKRAVYLFLIRAYFSFSHTDL